MAKIGWIDLKLNIFHLGNLNAGKQQNMKEYVKAITNVHGLGTFAMNEGQALLTMIIILVGATFLLNAIVIGLFQWFMRITIYRKYNDYISHDFPPQELDNIKKVLYSLNIKWYTISYTETEMIEYERLFKGHN